MFSNRAVIRYPSVPVYRLRSLTIIARKNSDRKPAAMNNPTRISTERRCATAQAPNIKAVRIKSSPSTARAECTTDRVVARLTPADVGSAS